MGEKAAKEKEKESKEAAAKEKADKEKAAKAKEKADKAKEKADKEKVAKEKAAKEKTAKEKTAKEKAAKEKADKEKAAKVAAEKNAKEKSAKLAAEKASKERSFKTKVTYHAWSGWINNWDQPLNYAQTTSEVNGWDAEFAYTCPSNTVITGLQSYHSNWYEDRRWKITCGRFKGMSVQASAWPGYQTKWDAEWGIGCGHNPMIGIGGKHSNWYEDRLFRIRCGKLSLRM